MNPHLIYYKVTIYWPEPAGILFLAADLENNKILYFADCNLNDAVGSLDLNDMNAIVPQILSFSRKASMTALCRLIVVMRENKFPEKIGHANCAVNVFLERISEVVQC